MTELTISVSTTEALRAAVQNGADAVIINPETLITKRGGIAAAAGEFKRCAEYCRVRGVNIYAACENITADTEIVQAAGFAVEYARSGANAIITADIGLTRVLRKMLPGIPLHSSDKLCVQNLDDAKFASAIGFTRLTLPVELAREDIAYITKYSGADTEVIVHGAACASYRGQCAFSAVTEYSSANRGKCFEICRLPYGGGAKGDRYPLSMKDICLAEHVNEIVRAGVKAIKINAVSRTPEYAAFISSIYSKALREHKQASAFEMTYINSEFSNGTTNGYYLRGNSMDMFGVRKPEPDRNSELMRTIKQGYQNGEYQRVPVRFLASVKAGKPARLVAQDDRKNTASSENGIPEQAFYRPLTSAALSTQLRQTGGTPFYVRGVKSAVDPGLKLPVEHVHEMRRLALAQLLEKRKAYEQPRVGEFETGLFHEGRAETPVITISVLNANQLSREMLELRPEMVYVPAGELSKTENIRMFVESGVKIAIILPRAMYSSEKKRVEAILKAARKAGIRDVLCTGYGQVPAVRKLGMIPRGDYSLNITNSHSMGAARDIGLKSVTASFEMTFKQIRSLSKPVDTEILAYGRLPLMLTENCIIKNVSGVCSCGNFRGIENSRGIIYPVVRESGCRNIILNAQKLFLADKNAELQTLGVWAIRLCFTTENAKECVDVYKRYAGNGDYAPGGFTRGLYYKNVYEEEK